MLLQVQLLMYGSLLCEVLSNMLVMVIVLCIKGGKRKCDELQDGGKKRVCDRSSRVLWEVNSFIWVE